MAKNKMYIHHEKFKTFFGREINNITITSEGKMYEGKIEISPCHNCGGPIFSFQNKLEKIVDGKKVYEHADKKDEQKWHDYLSLNSDIKQQYETFAQTYKA